jgi:hypothetical protein
MSKPYHQKSHWITTLIFILTVLVMPAYSVFQTEYVVLVIIDGLRYSEGLGHPDQLHVPRMADLAAQGAIVDNFRNDGYTYTSRAIPAIWCGAWTETYSFSDPDCNGSTNKYTDLPTVFEYYRQQLDKPDSDCIYTIKDLCPWKASFHADYGPDYWPLYHSEGYSDIDVWQETEQIIATLSPHLLLMYLADVDNAGHSGDWDDYISAITIADSLVGCLWDAVQANPLYTGKTTLLVTNDHGRHDYDFTGHGDNCEGCRRIQLLAVGPDVEVGLVSDIQRSIPDITPTIGELMGFTADFATGTAMIELFTTSAGLNSSPEIPWLNPINYPNPFSPVTIIQYKLPHRPDVEVTIYDLLGNEVTTLVSETQEAGIKSVQWDATNVASGMYFYQIRAGKYVQTRKMVLLKYTRGSVATTGQSIGCPV